MALAGRKGDNPLKKTKIEWCDSTFNPITGCLHHCPYCYARTMVYRFAGAIENEKQLYEDDEPVLDQEGRKIAYPHGFAPTFHKHRLAQVRHWKDEKPRNIFVCSMADIFGDWVPEEWITQITDAFKEAPQHNYLFLTKNPIRMINLIERGVIEEKDNFWFGTTTTKADDMFFASETANAFVSIEPMHGPLEIIPPILKEQLKWAIIGAETGNRAGKIVPEPDWILEAAYNFEQLGIPVFMKDSLIPIIGEENMKREFPEGLRHGGDKNESSM